MAKRGAKPRPHSSKAPAKPAKKAWPKAKLKKPPPKASPAQSTKPKAARPSTARQTKSAARSNKKSLAGAKSSFPATAVLESPALNRDTPVPIIERQLPVPPAPIVAPGAPVLGESPAIDPTPLTQAILTTAQSLEHQSHERTDHPDSAPPASSPAVLVFGNTTGPRSDELAHIAQRLPDPPAELAEVPVIETDEEPAGFVTEHDDAEAHPSPAPSAQLLAPEPLPPVQEEVPEVPPQYSTPPVPAASSPPHIAPPPPYLAEPERTVAHPPGPDWKPEPTVHTTLSAPPPSVPASLQPAPPGASLNGSPDAAPPPPLLFEIGWEVCWQLGGIYTVLKTKAVSTLQTWGDRYTLIGPYNPHTAALEFEEMPASGLIAQTLDHLREQGIPCHYGRWLIPGRPRVILLDYRARFRHLDQDKYLMWADHHIATPPGDGEVNEVIAFGFTVAQFFQELANLKGNTPVLAHFHEWMGGVAIPRIAHLKIPVQTIFTTHATLLGRYLASDNPNFYDHLSFINPDAEAQRYNIFPRFQIEKAAAHASTVFTTVSEVTAVEASRLLGRMPEVILPNGLNIQRFAALHEFQNLHRQFKERIHEFVMAHFFPSYTFDLDNTLYFFTAGRYEYKNKGLDLYIEALHRLNQKLRAVPDHPTVVAFIVTKAAVRNISVDVLKNHAMFEELRQTCTDLQEEMGRRLFLSAATGRLPTFGELLPDDGQVRLKRAMHAWRTNRQPAYVTHDMVYDQEDPVLKHIRHRWFFNAADDPVKMVFHPEFVSATSPILGLDYEQFVRGCHMGVFPSYYEPWGYTPMESIALGVPSVTTDLSGFGAYVNRHITKNAAEGVYVLDRAHQGFEQSAEALAEHLLGFCKLNRRQRIELRNRTERLGEAFDWSNLIRHYHEAHALALERNPTGQQGKLEVRMI